MKYASLSLTEGLTLDDYRAVSRILGGAAPDGLALEIAADGDTGLHVVSIWQSKDQHDAFLRSRLLPAFQAAGLQPGRMTVTELEIGEALIGGVPTSA